MLKIMCIEISENSNVLSEKKKEEIKENVVVEYAKDLQRTSVSILTQTSSQNADSRKVDRKVAVKSRKRNYCTNIFV